MAKIKLSFKNSAISQFFFSRGIVDPQRDWIILIILFVVAIIGCVTFDVYMYSKIVSGDIYVSVSREDLLVENLKRDNLKNILNSFDTKKEEIKELKISNLVDPSL